MLPTDVLERVANEDQKLPGLRPSDYGLAETERLGEAITRSWTRLTDIHRAFADELAASPLLDTAGGPTFKHWLRFLFQELGYGTLTATPTARTLDDAGSQTFAISHQWNHVPIHLVGVNVPLDRRTAGVTGASRSAPHSLVQEWLNRSEGSLWGIVSNGRQLRLVRDNVSMTRQAFVEFDLEAIFKGQSFADFRLLWLVLHATRFDIPADGQPHQCVIEQWHVEGATVGTRVLGELSTGVKHSIEALGRGFLAHPANDALRTALASGTLDKQEYYRCLLRLVYRFLFLFVTESRGLLLDPAAPRRARDLYTDHYSATRLQTLAGKRGPDAEKAILALKICDTAVGSGHFLIGAAHRIAKRLAAVRTGDAEPSPEAYRTALRDCIRNCLYGHLAAIGSSTAGQPSAPRPLSTSAQRPSETSSPALVSRTLAPSSTACPAATQRRIAPPAIASRSNPAASRNASRRRPSRRRRPTTTRSRAASAAVIRSTSPCASRPARTRSIQATTPRWFTTRVRPSNRAAPGPKPSQGRQSQ